MTEEQLNVDLEDIDMDLVYKKIMKDVKDPDNITDTMVEEEINQAQEGGYIEDFIPNE